MNAPPARAEGDTMQVALAEWLDEQINREKVRAAAATEPDDEAFYEGMVDAYKLVYREWVEKR